MDEPSQETPPVAELAALTEEQRQALSQLAESANEKLFQAGADGAEQSFGLGCVVFALPLLVVDLLLFLFRVFNLILALMVLFMGALAVAGIVTLMAYNARARTISDTYRREVESEIAHYLAEHHLGRAHFDSLASEILATDAPLRAFLAPSPAMDIP
jgi:hypothetical protein